MTYPLLNLGYVPEPIAAWTMTLPDDSVSEWGERFHSDAFKEHVRRLILLRDPNWRGTRALNMTSAKSAPKITFAEYSGPFSSFNREAQKARGSIEAALAHASNAVPLLEDDDSTMLPGLSAALENGTALRLGYNSIEMNELLLNDKTLQEIGQFAAQFFNLPEDSGVAGEENEGTVLIRFPHTFRINKDPRYKRFRGAICTFLLRPEF